MKRCQVNIFQLVIAHALSTTTAPSSSSLEPSNSSFGRTGVTCVLPQIGEAHVMRDRLGDPHGEGGLLLVGGHVADAI